ncbi:MAG: hypothetical protein CME25_15285 [Gemmatimonadetes bacterium]|nr:hypothetical protein [Gemmatimonadota bacterium]
MIELGSMLTGGFEKLRARPLISAMVCWMVSPLHLANLVTDLLLEWCRAGLPIALSSAPMTGSTSPVTLAGTLAQLIAEQLNGVVLMQLVRSGTPVFVGYIPGLADMRLGGYLGGAVEFGMMQAAAARLARHNGVPIYCSGGLSDSKVPDTQAGWEKMQTFLLLGVGGANFIHHAIGMLHNMSAVSINQAVIDNDIVGSAMRVLSGIEVSKDSLGVDAIQRVGPGGHFLGDEHTLKHMRSECYEPQIADRRNREAWEDRGATTTRERASQRVSRRFLKHTSRLHSQSLSCLRSITDFRLSRSRPDLRSTAA